MLTLTHILGGKERKGTKRECLKYSKSLGAAVGGIFVTAAISCIGAFYFIFVCQMSPNDTVFHALNL